MRILGDIFAVGMMEKKNIEIVYIKQSGQAPRGREPQHNKGNHMTKLTLAESHFASVSPSRTQRTPGLFVHTFKRNLMIKG